MSWVGSGRNKNYFADLYSVYLAYFIFLGYFFCARMHLSDFSVDFSICCTLRIRISMFKKTKTERINFRLNNIMDGKKCEKDLTIRVILIQFLLYQMLLSPFVSDLQTDDPLEPSSIGFDFFPLSLKVPDRSAFFRLLQNKKIVYYKKCSDFRYTYKENGSPAAAQAELFHVFGFDFFRFGVGVSILEFFCCAKNEMCASFGAIR